MTFTATQLLSACTFHGSSYTQIENLSVHVNKRITGNCIEIIHSVTRRKNISRKLVKFTFWYANFKLIFTVCI